MEGLEGKECFSFILAGKGEPGEGSSSCLLFMWLNPDTCAELMAERTISQSSLYFPSAHSKTPEDNTAFMIYATGLGRHQEQGCGGKPGTVTPVLDPLWVPTHFKNLKVIDSLPRKSQL